MTGSPRFSSCRVECPPHGCFLFQRRLRPPPSIPDLSSLWWSQTSARLTLAPWEPLGTAPGRLCARLAMAGPSQGPGSWPSSGLVTCLVLPAPGNIAGLWKGPGTPQPRDLLLPSPEGKHLVRKGWFSKRSSTSGLGLRDVLHPPRTPNSDLAHQHGDPGRWGEGGLHRTLSWRKAWWRALGISLVLPTDLDMG